MSGAIGVGLGLRFLVGHIALAHQLRFEVVAVIARRRLDDGEGDDG